LPSVLDDESKLLAIDKSDMLGIVEHFPELCVDALNLCKPFTFPKEVRISGERLIRYRTPRQVVVTGMGGSAIGGDILKDWLEDRIPIPIQVNREYHLPAYADPSSLVVAVSYSGNTEETLSAYLEAVERGCMTLSLSSGGLLEDFNRRLGLPHFKLPGGYPPRSAMPYLFLPLMVGLQKLWAIDSFESEVDEAIKVVKELREEIKRTTLSGTNPAKQLAVALKGSLPMVCGYGPFKAIALRIKTQFNENSKTPAKVESFSELNHNETAGWSGAKDITRLFSVILIRSEDEPPEIRARIELTRRLIFDEGAHKVLEIRTRGDGRLAKMLSAMYIGDSASVYLGILKGFDPTPIPVIEELKRQLEMRVNKTSELKKRIERLVST